MRHYEKLLLSGESESLEKQLTSQTALSSCVEKVSRLLRLTLRSLGGEDPEALPAKDMDDSPFKLSQNGDETDWALQREVEIVRLERENQELRHMLAVSNAQAGLGGEATNREPATKQSTDSPLISSPSRLSIIARPDEGVGANAEENAV